MMPCRIVGSSDNGDEPDPTEEAMHKMQEAAPPDGEVAHFEETGDVQSIPDVVDDGAAFFNEVAFVDSEDGTEIYYERP